MRTFTIDNENSITAFGSQQEAAGAQGESFSSQQKLVALAANWPGNRLIEVWNGIPGLTPVKKFTNRKSAITRIWKAIQSLNGGAPKAAPSREQKAERAAEGWRNAPPDHEGHGLAGTFGTRLHQRRAGQEDGHPVDSVRREDGERVYTRKR